MVVPGPCRLPIALGVTWLALRLALVATGVATGEARQVAVGPHRVAVLLVRGETPARTLLVAAHGGLASKESLVVLCAEARQRGADCALVDALGHGASSAQPATQVIAALQTALRVDRPLGYTDVVFVGHSMGAYLGCGTVFPCARSVSLGQGVACGPGRTVRGAVHRALGLPASFYPLSHVLEPWTPTAVDSVLTLALGPKPGAGPRITLWSALTWCSFATALALGVVLARRVRTRLDLPPALRGVLGAGVVWAALTAGAWRTLWFLLPTQVSDGAVIAVLAGVSLAVSAGLGSRHPFFGVAVGAALSLLAATLLWLTLAHRELGGLLVLLPLLTLPLAPVVAVGERVSRGSRADGVESALFTALLLGSFVALLLPGF